MKKIFTLLFFVSVFATSFAQYSGNQPGDDRRNDIAYNNNNKKDDNRFNGHDNFRKKEMERKIADINREYDRKIQGVKDNWFMNRYRKQRLISELECKRTDEIKSVYTNFNDKRYEYDDHGPKKGW